jgi:hypothetical protein
MLNVFMKCYYVECNKAECCFAECIYGRCMLLNVVRLSVGMLNVVAPYSLAKSSMISPKYLGLNLLTLL